MSNRALNVLATVSLVVALGACDRPADPPAARVILLGVDGADWDVLDPLIEEGKLPAFARMKREGASGSLRSIEPIFSPVVWATISTGKLPEDHGITSFTTRLDSTGTRVPVSSNLVRSSRVWDILGRRGHDVGVIGWWTTWPATPVNGFLVSERAWPLVFGSEGWPVASDSASIPENLTALTYPDPLFEQLRPHILTRATVPAGGPVDVRGSLATINENGPSAADMYAKDLTFARFADRLYPVTRPDFFTLYLELPDVMAHYFWDFWRYYRHVAHDEPWEGPPPGGDPEAAASVGHNYEGSYVLADRVLDTLMRHADDSTLVVVVSDHGYGENVGGDALQVGDDLHREVAHWHEIHGVFLAWGYGVEAGASTRDAHVTDVTPTVLHALGEPVGEDMAGRVLEEIFAPGFARRKVATVPTHDDGPVGDGRPLPAAADSSTLELLESLGYIGN